MKKIYVVLSATPTQIGRMIRTLTGSSYNHASISLTRDFSEMYSFARFHAHNPFIGGFIREFPQRLTLGKDKEVQIKVFAIPVTDSQYTKIKEFIYKIRDDEERYLYNSLAVLGHPFGMGYHTYKAYVCTDFVIKALLCGDISIKEGSMLTPMTPGEMERILDPSLIYSGSLQNYDPAPIYDPYLVREFFRKYALHKEALRVIGYFYSLFRRSMKGDHA
jgi:hypothetical protein